MSDRRDISDIIRTADAQRRETPRSDLWARIEVRLGSDGGDAGTDPAQPDPVLNGHDVTASPPPSRGELLRRSRAQRREARLRRPRRTAWLAVAAAALVLLVATWTLRQADAPAVDGAAASARAPETPTGDQLDLVTEPIATRRVPANLYDGVTIVEGDVAVNELRTCSPC